jgi:steroid delta-isomerase-like uncharacterized protein
MEREPVQVTQIFFHIIRWRVWLCSGRVGDMLVDQPYKEGKTMASQPIPQPAVSPSQIHRALLDAWNRRDFDRFGSLLHPDYTYTGGDGKELTGGPDTGVQIARMYAGAFPDGRAEITRVHVQGDTSIAEFVARGTHNGELLGIAPTGRGIEINICSVIEVKDGKAYREREYFDMQTMLVQLGVASRPGE